jgi:outer membrane protein assembly factor BamB
LVVYGYDGDVKWDAGSLLDASAWASVPIVFLDGSVIAADSKRIVRFGAGGHLLWITAVPGGIPISPVTNWWGTIFIGTRGGPIAAFDAKSGELLSQLTLRDGPSDPHFFDTLNTVAVRGNRLYVSAQRNEDGENPDNWGRLVAVDFDPVTRELSEAWHFDVGAPSGASPLLIGQDVFFDADRPTRGANLPPRPTIFAVRDNGGFGELRWSRTVDYGRGLWASMARDPRGGLWHFSAYDSRVIRLDAETGEVLQTIDLDALIEDPKTAHGPSSAMTIAGGPRSPTMIVGIAPTGIGPAYVAAVDLASEDLSWKVELSRLAYFPFGGTSGQFPILTRMGNNRVVFSSSFSGVFGVGVP